MSFIVTHLSIYLSLCFPLFCAFSPLVMYAFYYEWSYLCVCVACVSLRPKLPFLPFSDSELHFGKLSCIFSEWDMQFQLMFWSIESEIKQRLRRKLITNLFLSRAPLGNAWLIFALLCKNIKKYLTSNLLIKNELYHNSVKIIKFLVLLIEESYTEEQLNFILESDFNVYTFFLCHLPKPVNVHMCAPTLPSFLVTFRKINIFQLDFL